MPQRKQARTGISKPAERIIERLKAETGLSWAAITARLLDEAVGVAEPDLCLKAQGLG